MYIPFPDITLEKILCILHVKIRTCLQNPYFNYTVLGCSGKTLVYYKNPSISGKLDPIRHTHTLLTIKYTDIPGQALSEMLNSIHSY